MVLTFRSTAPPESVQIIVTDADGARRVATLQRADNRKWTGSINHPSGENWRVDTYDPDAAAALGNLAQAFASREVDYRESKGRGHKRSTPLRDPNVRVDDLGEYTGATITGQNRR
jgi:hypothetical protein